MIIIMAPGATEEHIEQVKARLTARGYGIHISQGVERTVIGAIGALDEDKLLVAEQLEVLPFVERVVPILKPYKLVSREARPERSRIPVGDVLVGGDRVVVAAGPCAVESQEQIVECARAIRRAGGAMLRGGAFKPRTSPYDFQGLGEKALEFLVEARRVTGLPIVTEVMDVRQLDAVYQAADVLQIGTRNMQNFDLLKEVGRGSKPVLLKRGFAATIEEWLKAAEYVASSGNLNVILCERGIRTFETKTRNTLDLSAVPIAQHETHLPVMVDPSHGTGISDIVAPMALAAVAAGADGLLIEVHPTPATAQSDGPQSVTPDQFGELMSDLRKVAAAVGRAL
ncbi:MAG: 3-deoxy-7-phosphoheptulonate synthase [Armatimonadota bacterium]